MFTVHKLELEISKSKSAIQCDTCIELKEENQHLNKLYADLKNQQLKMEISMRKSKSSIEYYHEESKENINITSSKIEVDQGEKYKQLMEECKQMKAANEDLNEQLETEIKISINKI